MKTYISHQVTMDRTASTPPALAYSSQPQWRKAAKEKLTELLGMPQECCADDFTITETQQKDGYRMISFEYQSEPGYCIPCHLLVPDSVKGPNATMICLQGHSTGMHFSLGQKKFETDTDASVVPRSFALQAVEHGMNAIVMDQRYMGAAGQLDTGKPACLGNLYPALSALLWGRTAIGERVWDIMRLIDTALANLSQYVDPENILCLGTSGGGTATYYAACMEERIRTAVVSCALCNYEDSIMPMRHCPCNYIPGIRKYFEMGDLGGLIAPRRLVVYSGQADKIFPIAGSREAFGVVKQAFTDAGVPDQCRMVEGPEGHGFAPDLVWPVIMEVNK